MEGINLVDTIGYLINVGTIALAYWLLKVRDRLLVLENEYRHMQDKVDGGESDIDEIKDRLSGIERGISSLVVELRSKGVINGAHKPPVV